MRFFGIDGTLAKARRYVSGASNVQDEEVKDPVKLAEILRGLMKRITEAEAHIPPEGLEFEVEIPNIGAPFDLQHNFNGPVRYWVVYWTADRAGTAPSTAPILVVNPVSDDNTLTLNSYNAGRAIIRVEPAFKGINLGIA